MENLAGEGQAKRNVCVSLVSLINFYDRARSYLKHLITVIALIHGRLFRSTGVFIMTVSSHINSKRLRVPKVNNMHLQVLAQ